MLNGAPYPDSATPETSAANKSPSARLRLNFNSISNSELKIPLGTGLKLGFLTVIATLQTENLGAVIKEQTVTDLVKRGECTWRDCHFKIIEPDVVVDEITARTMDAEEKRPIRTLLQIPRDAGGRGYCGGKCTVADCRHPGILR